MSKCVKDSIQSEGRVRESHDDGKNSAHRGSDSSRSGEKARRSDTSMTVDSSLAVTHWLEFRGIHNTAYCTTPSTVSSPWAVLQRHGSRSKN